MAEYLANIDDMDDDNDDIVHVDDSQMDTGRGGRQRGRKRNREDQTWSNYVPPEEAALSQQIHTSDNPGWRAVPYAARLTLTKNSTRPLIVPFAI